MSYRYSKFLPSFTFLCDLLLLNIAMYNPLYLSLGSDSKSGVLIVILSNLVWVLLSPIYKIYKISRPLILTDNLNKFFQVLFYHLLIVLGIAYVFKNHSVAITNLLITYVTFVTLVFCHRFFLSLFLNYIRKHGYNCRNILILGDERIVNKLTEHFDIHPEYGYDLIRNAFPGDITSYTDEEIINTLSAENPDEIFLCYKEVNNNLISLLTQFGTEYSVKIKLVSDMILVNSYARVVNYDSLPMLQVKHEVDLSRGVKLAKRGFDVAFSLVAIVGSSPLLLTLYLVTRLSSKGPAYYTQERIGLNGKPFKIIKFRSMYIDAEKYGPQLSQHQDPRVTKWGRIIRKTRLDELPQFYNVLKGDMSIVGPRPERLHFIEKISARTPQYKKLLSIKPGITSIGQVHYGYASNVEQMCERMEYDLLYLQNISFNSDLRLIFKTVKVMVQGKGQ